LLESELESETEGMEFERELLSPTEPWVEPDMLVDPLIDPLPDPLPDSLPDPLPDPENDSEFDTEAVQKYTITRLLTLSATIMMDPGMTVELSKTSNG